MKLKRVVVTGLGALTPLGNSIPELWSNLVKGANSVGPITRFDASLFKTRFACEVKNFNITDLIDRKEARKIDPYAQYAIVASDEAMRDANLDLTKIDLDKAGVIWASGIGGLDTFYDECVNYAKGDGTPRFNPFFVPKMIADIACGHISIKYGFRGVNFATVSACASSNHALIDAFNYIRLGKANVIISGGSESPINQAGVGGFGAMHALSTRNDDPSTASRPFDKDRDGFVLSEGGVALVLEEYEHAINRGAKIYGEIIGGGMTADAHHITAPHPEGLGAYNVMKVALEDAEVSLEEVDYINAHGTSTPLNDKIEPNAIARLFGSNVKNISVTSSKSMTGHLLGGAGAIEAAISLLSIKNGIVTPTINHFNDDPEIPSLNFVFNKAQEKQINIALSNTFGFGGHNACVVFKKI